MIPKNKRIVNLELIAEVRKLPCVISGKYGVDVHHLISRKSGVGHDLEWNLCPLLRVYHNEIHNKGKVEMAKKYPKFKEWLILKGWKLDQRKWVRHE